MRLFALVLWVLFSFQTFASDSEFKDLKCPQCSKTDDLKRINRGVIETLQNLEDDKVSEEELKELRGYLEYLEKNFPQKPTVKVKKSFFKRAKRSISRKFKVKSEAYPSKEPEYSFINKPAQDIIYEIVEMVIHYVAVVKHTEKNCKLRAVEDDEKRLNIEPKIDDSSKKIALYRALSKLFNVSKSDLLEKKEKCDLIMQILSILNAIPKHFRIEGHDKKYEGLSCSMNLMMRGVMLAELRFEFFLNF